MRDESSARAAVQAVEEAEGAVGVLVNNAGYGHDGLPQPDSSPYGDYHAAVARADAETDQSRLAGDAGDVARLEALSARLCGKPRLAPDRAHHLFGVAQARRLRQRCGDPLELVRR